MVIRLGPGAEFDLIRRFLDDAPGKGRGVRIGPGDDCAVVAGNGIAVTVDMAVEDVHFRRGWVEPDELGYHAAAGALSDLAAVGARPIGVLASVALGPGDERGAGRGIMEGVTAAVRDLGAVLLGGDLTRSPGPIVVDIVAVGEASAPVLRKGARPGDEVWVTGELGGAAAAVEAWLNGSVVGPVARAAWARPQPRIGEALWLVERSLPTAMVDLSDGLAGDAGHIAAASGVRIRIEAPRLPISIAARGGREAAGKAAEAAAAEEEAAAAADSVVERDAAYSADAVRLAVAGGEDYELCFTASPGAAEGHVAEFEKRWGVRLTRVGVVEEGEGVIVVDERGSEVRVEAFQHWRNG